MGRAKFTRARAKFRGDATQGEGQNFSYFWRSPSGKSSLPDALDRLKTQKKKKNLKKKYFICINKEEKMVQRGEKALFYFIKNLLRQLHDTWGFSLFYHDLTEKPSVTLSVNTRCPARRPRISNLSLWTSIIVFTQ